MNLSKQEWYTAGVGIIVIIGIISIISFQNKGKDVTNTSMNDATQPSQQSSVAGTTTTKVEGKNISKNPGIEIIEVQTGTGKEAKKGDEVYVHYTGTFTNGTTFDSSVDRGEPINFTLGAGRVIKGWDLGLEGMKVGGKRHLIISSDLAYGPNDYGPIPGGSTLVFDVELVDVK